MNSSLDGGYIYFIQGDLANSFNYYLGAKKSYQRLKDHQSLVAINENLGSIALETGSYETAKTYMFYRLENAKHLDNREIANAYFDLGLAYFHSNGLDSAVLFHLKALHTCKSEYTPEHSQLIARILNELGRIQYLIATDLYISSRLDGAIHFFNDALAMDQSTQMRGMILNNLGKAHLEKKDYLQAKHYF